MNTGAASPSTYVNDATSRLLPSVVASMSIVPSTQPSISHLRCAFESSPRCSFGFLPALASFTCPSHCLFVRSQKSCPFRCSVHSRFQPTCHLVFELAPLCRSCLRQEEFVIRSSVYAAVTHMSDSCYPLENPCI